MDNASEIQGVSHLSPPARPWRGPAAVALLALVLLLAAVLLRSAWLSDDGYILLRTVDNAVHGHGLRWNIAERVQSYTCPLWTLLLTAAVALTGETYLTTLGVSLATTALALAGLLRRSRSAAAAALAVLALLMSKAFVDFSTSGLENPLTHLLLVAFAGVYLGDALPPPRRAAALGLLAGLLALNRLDAALLVAPALALELARALPRARGPAAWTALQPAPDPSLDRAQLRPRLRSSVAPLALGLLPLLAWHAFSLIYYGFVLPNTAYAKLYTGVPRGELVAQGLAYLQDSLRFDPVTLPLVGATALAAAWTRQTALAALLAGPLLYAAYALQVGGDFMSGRFLSGAVLLAALALAQGRWPSLPMRQRHLGVAALASALLALGFAAPFPAALARRDYRFGDEWGVVSPRGIADERGLFYRSTGLFSLDRRPGPLNHPWAVRGQRLAEQARSAPQPLVVADYAVGMLGYYAGPAVHVVDRLALNDALLARLPCKKPWRIGHFERELPEGYLDSLRSGRNLIGDPQLARRFAQIQRITRAPLWDRQRWRDIVDIHLR